MIPTPHDPAVQALIDAVDKAKASECSTYTPEHERLYHDIVYAREALRPKPEMERVLDEKRPEWLDNLLCRYFGAGSFSMGDANRFWHELVTLTSRPAQEQKYHMPIFEALVNAKHMNGDLFIQGTNYSLGKSSFNLLRAKILSMNKETTP